MAEKKHRGLILKGVIDRLGLKIKEVARQANISRGTLYNYFNQPDLDDETMLKMGKILRYDFSLYFAELIPVKQDVDEEDPEAYGLRTTEELCQVQRKYCRVIEKYNNLLKVLVKLSIDYNLKDMRRELSIFRTIDLKNE